jgi:hypothetical protein
MNLWVPQKTVSFLTDFWRWTLLNGDSFQYCGNSYSKQRLIFKYFWTQYPVLCLDLIGWNWIDTWRLMSNFTEWSPSWEANSHSGSWRFIPVFTRACQKNPVPNLLHYFFKIHSCINLPSMPRSSKWSLFFRSSKQNFVHISHLPHACCMSHPYHTLYVTALIIG